MLVISKIILKILLFKMFKIQININKLEILNVKKFVINGNLAKNINANKYAVKLKKEFLILMVIICVY